MKQTLDTLYFIDDSDDEKFLTELLFGVEKINLEIMHFFNLEEFNTFYHDEDNKQSIGMLIVDLNMPIQNGVEIVSHIKQNNGYEDLIVGICTGSEDPADKKNATAAGADFFIQKPFNTKSLKITCDLVQGLDLVTNEAGQKNIQISQ